MRSYESKEELKNEIKKTFEKYISEFDNIPEELKDKRLKEVDRSLRQTCSSCRFNASFNSYQC